jgi:hypothetical protein
MKDLLSFLSRSYSRLLALFPPGFREQFRADMCSDFADGLHEAAQGGLFSALKFLLREALDLPGAVLHAHLEEANMVKVLRSGSMNAACRGALGFGAAYALSSLVSTWAMQTMLAPESFIGDLQVHYYDLFRTEHGLELISEIPSMLSSLVTGLLVGIGLGILFGKPAYRLRYALAGMLGWFLHDVVINMFWIPQDLNFYLGTRHATYLADALRLLSGAFLGLIFVVARSQKPEPLRWLAIGGLAYPVITYLYVRLLFKLFIVETPRLFIALMFLVMLFIASVFFIAVKSDPSRRAAWLVVIGGVSIILSSIVAGVLIRTFLPGLIPSMDIPHSFSWNLQFQFAAMDAIYGLLFGLSLGLILGLQRRLGPPVQMPPRSLG